MKIKEQIEFAAAHPECIRKIDLEFRESAVPKLLGTSLWPKAVNENLIVGDEDAKKQSVRARSIVRSFITDGVEGKKFLDFGSGTASCKNAAAEAGAEKSVAYDLKPSAGVSQDWQGMRVSGPYDIILMYDVIDHLVDSDGNLLDVDKIPAVLKNVKSVLAEGGKIFARCHPWTSRHGTHCYLKTNKAYAHYVNDESDGLPTIKITAPVSTYENIFKTAGLKIVSKNIIEQTVESLFETPAFRNTFQGHFAQNNSWMYRKVMSFTFIDFVLC